MLTLSKFNEIMQVIKDQIEYERQCADAFQVLCKSDYISGYVNNLYKPLIYLLEESFGDSFETIDYFIWELDFGAKYYEGCMKNEKDESIDISSVEKLYEYIKG